MRTTDPADYFGPDAEADRALMVGEDGDVPSDTFSVIDQHSSFDGIFHSDRDLRIEGEVKGTIECRGTLFVAQGANVTAKVEAENITVAGDLNGDIRSRGRLQIMPSGRVRGKVGTQTLVINEGAYYEGQLEMAAPEDRVGAAPPRSVTSPPLGGIPTAGDARGAGQANSTTFIRRLGGPETPWAPRDEPEADDAPPEDDES